MKWHLKKIRVSCSVSFLLLVAGLIYLDGVCFFAQVLTVCVLHEFGHFAAALAVGSRVCNLRLTAVGAEMELDSNVQLSYAQDAILALSGPIVNLAVAWLAVRFGGNLFAGLNFCFGLLNLLPVRPLDGGRILVDLLSLWDSELAEKIHYGISVLFSGLLLGLGWAAWRGWENLSLFFTALWLAIGMLKK